MYEENDIQEGTDYSSEISTVIHGEGEPSYQEILEFKERLQETYGVPDETIDSFYDECVQDGDIIIGGNTIYTRGVKTETWEKHTLNAKKFDYSAYDNDDFEKNVKNGLIRSISACYGTPEDVIEENIQQRTKTTGWLGLQDKYSVTFNKDNGLGPIETISVNVEGGGAVVKKEVIEDKDKVEEVGPIQETTSYELIYGDLEDILHLIPALTEAQKKSTPDVKEESTTQQYTVKQGDSLSKIAKEYGTTVDAIVEANSITNKDLIKIDQVLNIPTDTKDPIKVSGNLVKQTYVREWYQINNLIYERDRLEKGLLEDDSFDLVMRQVAINAKNIFNEEEVTIKTIKSDGSVEATETIVIKRKLWSDPLNPKYNVIKDGKTTPLEDYINDKNKDAGDNYLVVSGESSSGNSKDYQKLLELNKQLEEYDTS
ncbi:LysM peptidoglycan-binding domain-containing protein [Candidatus Woesearchaeota archaeon]|nr:LysM peptidoglycan-binding domain-containing protein [Candidatus Woesearchaeota archaeon]